MQDADANKDGNAAHTKAGGVPPGTPLVHWMLRRHLPDILAIDNECYGRNCWTSEELKETLKYGNIVGMVAEFGVTGLGSAEDSGGTIAGFMVYELLPKRFHLLKLAVDWSFQRRGVGTAMVDKLKGKLAAQRRRAIQVEVRESNLDAQLFLRAQGFEAIDILRCERHGETYLFQYSI